jgi:tRNA (cytidine/uridine-2'-O-)-methyltransferase
MHIILHQPEIPQNTGNIGRTCVATGTSLHLIEPLGFRINEKELKRAGMDYWDKLDVTRYIDYEDFKAQHPGAKSGTPPPRQKGPIAKFLFPWTITSCLEKRARESLKRSWWTMRIPA